ncbi:MAG: hypothetical protein ACRD5D_07200, partial [Candidatus Polarisedimenticolia bacterium]
METIVGSDRRQALDDIAPGRSVVLDLHDPDTAAAQIERFAAERPAGPAPAHSSGTGSAGAPPPIAAIIPTDDESAVVAAEASARLGLPHN